MSSPDRSSDSPSDSSRGLPFDRVGRYAVRRRIGSGGFATVWLAYDEHLDSPVAVKVLADNWSLDDQVRRRFVDEGRYLRRVDSPHVVSVHDAGELADGRPYLVMTYADQGSLADRLGEPTAERLPPGQALGVVRQLAAGLQALHDHDVLHRDVKPGNVLFKTASAGESRVVLGDLGLGKALDVSSRLTMVAGTPLFVAPEQAAAESPDARADQYSLAALTFLLLAGAPPYAHATLQAAAEPGPPPALPEAFGAATDRVVRRALARDRDERWPSVTAFAEALTEALAAVDVVAAPVPVAPAEPAPSTDTVAHPPPSRVTAETAPVAAVTAPAPRPRRRRVGRVLRWSAAGLVVALLGGAAGWAGEHTLTRTVQVADVSDALSVTVPKAWDRVVARDGWQPPSREGDAGTYPALSVGTRSGWADRGGQGVFVGILPATRLPEEVPQHAECSSADEPLPDRTAAGDEMVTVVFTGCPGVTVERVVRITENRLLWVQVRAASRAAAYDVLDEVRTHGI